MKHNFLPFGFCSLSLTPRATFGCLLLLGLNLPPAPGIEPSLQPPIAQVGGSLQQATQLYRAGRFRQALAALEEATRQTPQDGALWHLRGKTLVQLRQYREAMDSYNNAVRYTPRDPQVWESRADLLQFLGQANLDGQGAAQQYQLAVESYDRALQLRPTGGNLAQTWLARSTALFGLGNELARLQNVTASDRYREAVHSYDQAIRFATRENDTNQMVNAWWQQGEVLRRLQQFPQALKAFEQALQLQPDFAEGWYRRGRVLRELKRLPDAVASYQKAIDLDPDYAEAWYNQGIALLDQKQYAAALQRFDQAIDGTARHRWQLETVFSPAFAWYGRGNALGALRCFPQAIVAYDQALRLRSNFPEAQNARKQAQALEKRPVPPLCQKYARANRSI